MVRIYTLIIFISISCLPQSAFASMCMDRKASLKSEYDHSYYVATGRILSIGEYRKKYYTYDGRKTYDEYRIINFSVSKMYKGPHTGNIYFQDENDSSRIPAKVGDKWLLFFTKIKNKKILMVNTCGHSTRLPPATNIDILERLSRLP